MDNKFAGIFTDTMTEKQIGLLYYQLIDKFEKGSQDRAELDEAFSNATNRAMDRAIEKCKAIEDAAPEGMDCVVCM